MCDIYKNAFERTEHMQNTTMWLSNYKGQKRNLDGKVLTSWQQIVLMNSHF